VDFWFVDPFAPHQLVAWTLLVVSLILVIEGVRLLRAIGKPDQSRKDDSATLAFEKTTTLVEVGAYKLIRHPLYSSLLFLTWGIFFKMPAIPSGVLALLATIFLIATAKVEERENSAFSDPRIKCTLNEQRCSFHFYFE
jgi:protein-S-isoprenylcysteine O-methyltransferase Ste14